MTPKERLLLLADKLDEDANNPNGIKFDLEEWFLNKEELRMKGKEPHIDCDTVGCAIGLAMLTPEFNEEGFTKTTYLTPAFRGTTKWDAVETYFGLSGNTAIRLFYSGSYPANLRTGADAERAVAGRIRDLVYQNT